MKNPVITINAICGMIAKREEVKRLIAPKINSSEMCIQTQICSFCTQNSLAFSQDAIPDMDQYDPDWAALATVARAIAVSD